MAYPMVQMPTFAEFRGRLVGEFGCTYEQLPDPLIVNDGAPATVRYLKRIVGEVPLTYSVFFDEDERLMPSAIRSICARLEIDPSAFGLTLG